MKLNTNQKNILRIIHKGLLEMKANRDFDIISYLKDNNLSLSTTWGMYDFEIHLGDSCYACVSLNNRLCDVMEIGKVYFDDTYTEKDMEKVLECSDK